MREARAADRWPCRTRPGRTASAVAPRSPACRSTPRSPGRRSPAAPAWPAARRPRRPGSPRAPETQIAQGWPKSWTKFRPLIGIPSQKKYWVKSRNVDQPRATRVPGHARRPSARLSRKVYRGHGRVTRPAGRTIKDSAHVCVASSLTACASFSASAARTAQAGNRRCRLLSALRTHTNTHTKPIYYGKCEGGLTAPVGPGRRAAQ
jgi:hypothetical protein